MSIRMCGFKSHPAHIMVFDEGFTLVAATLDSDEIMTGLNGY